MKREMILTKDGSHSIAIPEKNIAYHSFHGALQESLHVFITQGMRWILPRTTDRLAIFEMGFGTGLNALLTLMEATATQRPIYYHAIDDFPLGREYWQLLNYCQLLERPDLVPVFQQLHLAPWEEDVVIDPFFILHKTKASLADHIAVPTGQYQLVYYDAFAPTTQPELWTTLVFEKLHALMLPGAALVTYCSKSIVRRALESAGFTVEKPPGPWGKREMLRAIA